MRCAYCGELKELEELVPLGSHDIHMQEGSNVRIRHQWICAPEMGCQKSLEAAWGAYFFGTLFYDMPFFVLGVIVITFMHFTIFQQFEVLFQQNAYIWEWAFCSIFIGTPILFSFILYPMFLSPIMLILFSMWIIQ